MPSSRRRVVPPQHAAVAHREGRDRAVAFPTYATPSETTAGNSVSQPVPCDQTTRNGGRSRIALLLRPRRPDAVHRPLQRTAVEHDGRLRPRPEGQPQRAVGSRAHVGHERARRRSGTARRRARRCAPPARRRHERSAHARTCVAVDDCDRDARGATGPFGRRSYRLTRSPQCSAAAGRPAPGCAPGASATSEAARLTPPPRSLLRRSPRHERPVTLSRSPARSTASSRRPRGTRRTAARAARRRRARARAQGSATPPPSAAGTRRRSAG